MLLQSFYKKNNSLTESPARDLRRIDHLNARPDFLIDGELEIAEGDDDASAATVLSRISEVVKDEEVKRGLGGADPIPGQGEEHN